MGLKKKKKKLKKVILEKCRKNKESGPEKNVKDMTTREIAYKN